MFGLGWKNGMIKNRVCINLLLYPYFITYIYTFFIKEKKKEGIVEKKKKIPNIQQWTRKKKE